MKTIGLARLNNEAAIINDEASVITVTWCTGIVWRLRAMEGRF